ncbi:TadE/TadG family type IV pilus assembly protein [Vibrio sp. HN007]|uniref:TadE/TadG family type IV pilus assembly protein n=1 Tax=Vibrio iocasae TaxID=3098914 RepID=UPI0035D3F198
MKLISRNHFKQKGLASVELTMVISILLMLSAGIFELTRMIQASIIATSISREGANLISRSSTETPEEVMDLVASTSNPLNLNSDGIIYMSLVVGQDNDLPYLSRQYRWQNYGYDAESEVWSGCPSWDYEGQCQISGDLPKLAGFPLSLAAGESVYVVEVVYRHHPILKFKGLFDKALTIRQETYL